MFMRGLSFVKLVWVHWFAELVAWAIYRLSLQQMVSTLMENWIKLNDYDILLVPLLFLKHDGWSIITLASS